MSSRVKNEAMTPSFWSQARQETWCLFQPDQNVLTVLLDRSTKIWDACISIRMQVSVSQKKKKRLHPRRKIRVTYISSARWQREVN